MPFFSFFIFFFFALCFTGGFYSDTKAYVNESCLKCPDGTYVPYNNAPGKRARDCIACPQGKHISNEQIDKMTCIRVIYVK